MNERPFTYVTQFVCGMTALKIKVYGSGNKVGKMNQTLQSGQPTSRDTGTEGKAEIVEHIWKACHHHPQRNKSQRPQLFIIDKNLYTICYQALSRKRQ